MTALHSTTTNRGHIDISNNYYYEPYNDDEPYFVDYADMDDDTIPPEGIIYAVCNTREEATKIENKLVKAAEDYNKSLLKEVYTFTEYLELI
jgi:hypothetical protein